MSFDFPASPTEGQTYQPAGGPLYTYKAPAWVILPTSAGVYVLKAGDTMTGNLSITPAVNVHSQIVVNSSGTGQSFIALVSREHSIFQLMKGDSAAGNRYAYLNSFAYHVPAVAYKQRWQLRMGDYRAESGSNVGSDFTILRFNDDGTYPADGEVFRIDRSLGYVTWDSIRMTFQVTGTNATGISHYYDRYQATPADQDYIFNALYRAKNRAGVLTEFARMAVVAFDIDAGAESAYFRFSLNNLGTLSEAFRIDTDGVWVTPGYIMSAGNALLCGTNANVYLRPQGAGTAGGVYTRGTDNLFYSYGDVQIAGEFIAPSYITTTSSWIAGGRTAVGIYFRGGGYTVSTEQGSYNSAGNLTIGGEGYKQVAGSWAAASDARIKYVTGDYTLGLAEILQLQPRTFIYKGNVVTVDTVKDIIEENRANEEAHRLNPGKEATPFIQTPMMHARMAAEKTECVGLIAQEAEIPMPEMVTQVEAFIDGEYVKDLRILNTTNVTYALINAVKEINTRLTALEAA